MNFNDQHPSDDIINRELTALRQEVEPRGLGDAISSMRANPNAPAFGRRRLIIGTGTCAALVAGITVTISLMSGKAYAGELHDIEIAQKNQKTMFQRSYVFQGEPKPVRTMLTWIDYNREAIRQIEGEGKVTAAWTRDGKTRHMYTAGNASTAAYAGIDEDHSEHFQIESITDYVHSDFFKARRIQKSTGVKLNGRTCDLYNFANGYYRIWVDPTTKLPLQREVYDKGVTLWQRDVYEYPPSFAKKVFEPYAVPNITYFDYPKARAELAKRVSTAGQSQTVGGVTISLRAVVRDNRTVRALWSTTGVDGWDRQGPINFQIDGVRSSYSSVGTLAGLKLTIKNSILNEELVMQDPTDLKLPATIRIAAWKPSKNGAGKELAGWATFKLPTLLTCPSNANLFWDPATSGQVQQAVAKDSE